MYTILQKSDLLFIHRRVVFLKKPWMVEGLIRSAALDGNIEWMDEMCSFSYV
jgi:hypothetical protein